ncbi:unnamed protein product [Owenia fusiformis]|uniref:Uncharacterized protein n=1 Tax=Owenia fusiformis TaxID=6347 RepID=A0A8S4NX86_OWEFU|nr:unnamed protein product [Owenia fusiformis]
MEVDEISDEDRDENLDKFVVEDIDLIADIDLDQVAKYENDDPDVDSLFVVASSSADSSTNIDAEHAGENTVDSISRVDDTVLEQILESLKTSSEKSRNRWGNVSKSSFGKNFTTGQKIQKVFLLDELKIVVKILAKAHLLKEGDLNLLKRKAQYVNKISETIGDKSTVDIPAEPMIRKAKPKKIHIKSLLNNLRKVTLCILTCMLEWPSEIAQFQRTSKIKSSTIMNETRTQKTQEVFWVTKPDQDEEGNPLFCFLDFHHLLTNTRCHIARHGYKKAGIHREAWVKVARQEKENGTGLNIAFVDDVVDPQSNEVATIFFSEEVKAEMEKNGDYAEAELTGNIGKWYRAVDERGIPAFERVKMVLSVRDWFLSQLIPHLKIFPPPTNKVNDIPIVSFEGFILSTERLIQMYHFTNDSAFNVRAVGSQMSETFFGSYRDLDPRSEGVLKPKELPKAMGTSCQLLDIRLDPNRSFCFNTTRRTTVYKERQLSSVPEDMDASIIPRIADMSFEESERLGENESVVLARDHIFDRLQSQRNKKAAGFVTRPDDSARGVKGIREFHRRNEEKILYHKRAGYNFDE